MFGKPMGHMVRTRDGLYTRAGYAVKEKEILIPVPEDPREVKIIYAKAGWNRTGPFWGLMLRMDRDRSIDQKGDDGLSARDHLLLYLMRNLEDNDGTFRFQGGDEANLELYFEELPASQHTQERWDAFVRREIPKRDSPQEEQGF